MPHAIFHSTAQLPARDRRAPSRTALIQGEVSGLQFLVSSLPTGWHI